MSIIYSIIIWPVFIFLTVFMIALGVPSVLIGKGVNTYNFIARYWAKMSLILFGVFYRIEGYEKLDKSKNYVFMGNHLSYVDIFMLLYAVRDHHFLFMAKKELFNIPVLGYAIKNMGLIPVERGQSREALKSLMNAAKMIASGYSVLLFPEGTRSADGQLLPFKKGAFMLATRTKLNIAPFVLKDTNKVLKKGGVKIHPFRRVTLTFLDPVNPSELKEKELTNIIREKIAHELGQSV